MNGVLKGAMMNAAQQRNDIPMMQAEKAYALQAGGQQTRRDRLNYQRAQLQQSLNAVDKAIAALDAHPELEEFIETLARAGA